MRFSLLTILAQRVVHALLYYSHQESFVFKNCTIMSRCKRLSSINRRYNTSHWGAPEHTKVHQLPQMHNTGY